MDGVVFRAGEDEVGVGVLEGEVGAGCYGVRGLRESDGSLGLEGEGSGPRGEEVLREDVAVDGVG